MRAPSPTASLLQRIHGESDKDLFKFKLSSYISEIRSEYQKHKALGSRQERFFINYYTNHIGRELNRKILQFELEGYFKKHGGIGGIVLDDPTGGGRRPFSHHYAFALNPKYDQSITWDLNPNSISINGQGAVNLLLSFSSSRLIATASSDLNVDFTFHATSPSTAAIVGDQNDFETYYATFWAPGTYTLLCNQAGNSLWNPAREVARTLYVLP